MKPSQVAAELIGIATKIQNSRNPDRSKVAAALKNVIKKIAMLDQDDVDRAEILDLMDRGLCPIKDAIYDSELDYQRAISYGGGGNWMSPEQALRELNSSNGDRAKAIAFVDKDKLPNYLHDKDEYVRAKAEEWVPEYFPHYVEQIMKS